jgi:hypothetical protein
MKPGSMKPGFRSSDPKRRLGRARKILLATVLDVLLLPLAFAVVLFEDVFWRAAHRLLRGLDRVPLLRAVHAGLGRLPAAAVLPLFLVPEAVSHLAGFLGAYLLARGQVATAVALLVLVKGMATLAVVWIYQAAAPTLLGVGWFARMHATVLFVREWSLAQVAPLRDALRARLTGSPKIVLRRFRAVRARLAAALKGLRMIF